MNDLIIKAYNTKDVKEKSKIILSYIVKLIVALDSEENVGLMRYLLNKQYELANEDDKCKMIAIRDFLNMYKKYQKFLDNAIFEYELDTLSREDAIKEGIYYQSKHKRVKELGDQIESITNKGDRLVFVIGSIERIINQLDDSKENEKELINELEDLKIRLQLSTYDNIDTNIAVFL